MIATRGAGNHVRNSFANPRNGAVQQPFKQAGLESKYATRTTIVPTSRRGSVAMLTIWPASGAVSVVRTRPKASLMVATGWPLVTRSFSRTWSVAQPPCGLRTST